MVVFWSGGSASRELVAGERLSIGRADNSDLVVPDDSVSRRHAVLAFGPPPTIEDAGSANGTLVGKVPLKPGEPMELAASSVVEIGDALLVVQAVDADSAPREPARADFAASELDPVMRKVFELVEFVAKSDIPLLLLGETGVGKGVIAETIHRRSARASGPFVRLNCAAIAETMLESELFGHERGAFTGAARAKPGLIESANGGSILLDEIGDMPPSAQAKLLHALDHGEVLRLGALKARPIDVRFIAATNRDLPREVEAGRFREDLYFRLNGVSITIPPLRERPSEIPSLARAFAQEACARSGTPDVGISDDALQRLVAHHWPGNVRELRNVVLRAALFARGGRIGSEHFGPSLGDAERSAKPALRDEVKRLEAARILEALEQSGHNQVHAAKLLGISRNTLRSRLKELGVRPPPRSKR